MRTQLITGALAVAATSALFGLGAPTATAQTPDPTQPGTSHEVGRMVECTGTAGRTPVRANIYQNRTYGNFLEVLVNDGRASEAGSSVQAPRPFFTGTKVRAATKIDGTRLVISGTAKPTSVVKKINDVQEDAGLRIVTTGTHRVLETRLVVSYGERTGKLSCDPAVAFNLSVTKTSIVD